MTRLQGDDRQDERDVMVREQIVARGIRHPRVLDAMRAVPRHRFVPTALRGDAYGDHPLNIGDGQTVSQPYIVALMTESLALLGSEKVLEIGAGCGYQTAILAGLCRRIVAVERHATLADVAREHLQSLNVDNVVLHTGDASLGWPAEGLYDAILVAAAAPSVPPPLIEQLAPGGRLILPVAVDDKQALLLIRKGDDGGIATQDLGAVAFVPLIGVGGYGLPDNLGDADI